MRALKITAAFVMATYFVACSPVKFDKAAESGICGEDGVACVTQCEGADCFNHISVSKTTGQQQVDILVINDNSGSMSPEQSKMATKFPTFIQSLGQLNYRIAMTTTDITSAVSQAYSENGTRPPEYNPTKSGYVQDGNLVTFGNGQKYLEGANGTSPSSNHSYFTSAVQRQETLTCEQSGYTNCPSSDERGIFAANLAIDKNQFMRPLAHLAVIVLSDEDERGISDSRSAKNSNDQALIQLYKRERYDLPQTLMDKMKSKFPGKSISVHPIIIRPGDSGCLSTQTIPSQNIRGVEGYSYQELFSLAGGTMGSICDNDYGSTLANIGSYVQKESVSLPFQCRPVNDDYDVTFDPKPAQDINVEADFDKLTLKVVDTLPPMTKVTLTYDCKK
jgi:hypothetical protein